MAAPAELGEADEGLGRVDRRHRRAQFVRHSVHRAIGTQLV